MIPSITVKRISVSEHAHSVDFNDFACADRYIREQAKLVVERDEVRQVRVVVLFGDLFVWTSYLGITDQHCVAKPILSSLIMTEWEFNAGVRPDWWPSGYEADRMWWVHFHEDRANGRAELARMRLERYDLRPAIRKPLPDRGMYAETH